MLHCVSSLLVFVISLSCATSAFSAECYRNFAKDEFPNCKAMSPTFALHWKVDAANATFGIDADEVPEGYVSLGVSEAGGMKAADIWTVTKDSSGAWTVWDMHSVAFRTPLMDTKQDVTLVSVPKVTANSIAAVITRRLRGCDVSDMDIHPNMSTPVIWAHGPTWKYHGSQNRGGEQLVLDGSVVEHTLPASAKTLQFLMPNVEIPTNRTTYWCTNFAMPNDRKYHAIEAKYKADSPLVHHMIVYGCTSKPPLPTGTLYPCDTMPTECTTPLFLWAPGTQDWYPPANAAVPIGKGYTQYVALQLHYTNPEGIKGTMDSSGVTVSYTPELRKDDIGLLILGNSNLTIPGGQSNYTVGMGLCPSECTEKFTQPLNVLAVGFHQHELGLSIKTQRYRKGVELPLMGVRNRWDFNYQISFEPLPNADVIMPGDTLITTCSYNSSTRSNVTKFGEETVDEMCFTFIQYYPRQEQLVCMSNTDRGLAVCSSTEAINELAQKYLKPQNSTVKPASNAEVPAKNRTAPLVSRMGNTGVNFSQVDMQAYMAAALSQGYMVLFDPSSYNTTKFTPFVPEDKCPAFLSAEDYGPTATTNTTKNAARLATGLSAAMLLLSAVTAFLL